MNRGQATEDAAAEGWAQALPFRVAAWTEWREGMPADPARPVPAGLRRRVTGIGRKALEAAWALLPAGTPDMRLVFASRHGEYQRTVAVLDQLAGDGTVSPADFSMSVHHSLAGLLSIATGNRAGHTAIAAGPDSFCYGLLEAAAGVAEERRPALLVYYDEPLPEAYGPLADDVAAPVALAVLLSPDRGEAMTLERLGDTSAGDQARAFAAFLASGRAEGGAAGWRWRRDP